MWKTKGDSFELTMDYSQTHYWFLNTSLAEIIITRSSEPGIGSATLIRAPVSSRRLRIILPPLPITLPIFSFGHKMRKTSSSSTGGWRPRCEAPESGSTGKAWELKGKPPPPPPPPNPESDGPSPRRGPPCPRSVFPGGRKVSPANIPPPGGYMPDPCIAPPIPPGRSLGGFSFNRVDIACNAFFTTDSSPKICKIYKQQELWKRP